ncbi:hypothetical protein H4R19_004854 [Coemansia spiralis]|nr:hypothetical protein H4R19_004854 [Coemansia spiralis]
MHTMGIFGSSGQTTTSHMSTDKSQRRKSLAATLSSSVKSLFAKCSQPTSALRARNARDSWLTAECTPEASPVTTRCSTALDAASIRHHISAQSLAIDDECGVRPPGDRYSQARARVLAETARRLQQPQQQARPQSPLTPSSIGTGRTLPLFAEEDEHEGQADDQGLAVGPAPADAAQSLLRASRETLREPAAEKQQHGEALPSQRYSVAMSQNLTRRFQTRAAHEYEQRIYCLHAHYADVIERMETRAHGDAEQLLALQKEVSGLRSDNAALRARVSDLKSQGRTGPWNLRRVSTAAGRRAAAAAADPYQDEVQRLTRETITAQEWVITLAELVVGPRKDSQSWDAWLNMCLDSLQRRREQQEQEWLTKIGWRASVQVGPVR